MFVTHQAVQVDRVKWLGLCQVAAHHHHAGHPEEDDIVARLHHASRVKLGEIRRLVGPAQGAEGPEARTEPGIENIGILRGTLGRGLIGARDNHRAIGQVPDRDAVAPPELARDTPVLDVFQPVVVNLLEALGDNPRAALAHGGQGQIRQGTHFHKPLLGEQRLDNLATTLTNPDAHGVRLGLDQQPLFLQIGDHGLAGSEAIQSLVGAALGVDRGVLVQDIDLRQPVTLADFVVVFVVGGGDLHRA